MTTTTRLIRLSELMTIIGLRHSRIYEMVGEGSFPQPVRLSVKAVAWRSDEIQKWIDSRPLVKLASPPS